MMSRRTLAAMAAALLVREDPRITTMLPRPRRHWLRARLLLVALLALGVVCDGQRVCDVASYGAVGDGVTQNIGAIRTALADCGGAGGGVLRIPTGDFVGAPFNLTSNMVLDVRGTLRGTTNLSLVPLMAPFPSMGGDITRDGYPCRFAPLVGAFNASNISITGGGVIDGATPRSDNPTPQCPYVPSHTL